MTETPKWRCGMTPCNARGLLAAKRSKSDATGSVEDADAESQDTAAMHDHTVVVVAKGRSAPNYAS